MSESRTFAPRAKLVRIADLRPGDAFMDMDGNRMTRLETSATIEAMTEEHQVWEYEAQATGFVCDPTPLTGRRGLGLLEPGDRVTVVSVPRRGSCQDAVGQTGVIEYGHTSDGSVHVVLDTPIKCRRRARASAVLLHDRLPWD